MGNIGYIAIVLALLAAIYAIIAFIVAGRGGSLKVFQYARYGLIAVSGLTTFSVLILLYAIFTHNFQMEYVASYTSLNSSPLYLLSALWAGNSGSLLFWAWLLSIFSLIALLQKQNINRGLIPYAAMVLMITEAFFLILLAAVMNPFDQLSYIPADGMGLNPMLENLGMVFHPPALLAGYVAFTIPFAMAISSMLKRKTDDEWLVAARKWTLLAWLLLGIGNIIGAWWAYVELGWGGYWAWDPVENAGLMPWLAATAFLHSSIIQRRKGIFKVWNMLLVILTFCLVIFGTFLTRSGILSSVHTFNDTGLAPYFIVFLAFVLFGSSGLLFYRYDDLRESGTEPVISRESAFMLNNILLIGAVAVILIGTIFPAISETFRGVKVSLAASFFNKVNGPLFLSVILLAGICTAIGWRQVTPGKLGKNMLLPLAGAFMVAVILFVTVVKEPVVLIAFFVCSLVILCILNEWFRELRTLHNADRGNYLESSWNLLWSNTQRYGGYIVHTGIIIIAIGVIGSSFYGTEKDATLKVGDSVTIGRYTVTYTGLVASETPDKSIVSAKLSIYNSGKLIDNLVSEKYFHKSQNQPVTEVAIRSTLSDDLYIILQSWRDNGAAADFTIMINPLVSWIWIGGLVFLIGGLITFGPNRRKKLSSVLITGQVENASRRGSVSGHDNVNPVSDGKSTSEEKRTDIGDDVIEEQVLKIRQQKRILCPRCKSNNPPNSRFCAKCGIKLNKDEKNG